MTALAHQDEREPVRSSPFSDLDNSIRAAYKILLDIRAHLDDGPSKKEHKIWIGLARWINFEKWYGYEKEPRVERLIGRDLSGVEARTEAWIALRAIHSSAPPAASD